MLLNLYMIPVRVEIFSIDIFWLTLFKFSRRNCFSCFFNEIIIERFQWHNLLDKTIFGHVQLTKFNDQHANPFHLPCSLKTIQQIAPGRLRLAWTELQAKNSRLE
jgi:hypothetical protein